MQDLLKRENVLARKYFYPIVPDMLCYKDRYAQIDFPVSREAADTVLALPMFADLSVEDVDFICSIILS